VADKQSLEISKTNLGFLWYIAQNERKLINVHNVWSRVVNRTHFWARTRHESEITSPNPTFIYEALFRHAIQI